MIICKICNKEFSVITWKHLQSHNITTDEYRMKYGDLVSPEYRALKKEQSKGKNNPNFGKKHSAKTRSLISEQKKGSIPHNRGKNMSVQQKKILSDAAIQRHKDWHDSNTHPVVGTTRSAETIEKIRAQRKKQIITREQSLKALNTRIENGYDLAFFRGKTHTELSKNKIIESTKEYRRVSKLKSTSALLEFAITEGFIINEIIDDVTWNVTCPSCGYIYDITKQYFYPTKYKGRRCISCDAGYSYISKDEQEIYDFVKSICPDAVQCDRSVLGGKELDILIPSKKIAIEYCGLYWHSDNFKSRDYHLSKVEKCSESDIRLITIFEDEWYSDKGKVKDVLANIIDHGVTTIYARKCTIQSISSKTANMFLKENHLQGSGRSNHRYGLYYDGDLFSVMTFSNSNLSRKQYDWEINRYCTKRGFRIVGGANKLFKRFVKDFSPTRIISYSDRRWFDGKVYTSLGFELDSYTPVNYWYWKPNEFKRYHRYALRKNNKDNQHLTEWQNRMEQGWFRIWDCGNSKYVWTP